MTPVLKQLERRVFRNAAWLAKLAAFAYEPAIAGKLLPLHEVVPIEAGNASGFVAFDDEGAAVIAIAGTNDARDCVDNALAFSHVDRRSGFGAHKGMLAHALAFYAGMERADGDIFRRLREAERVYVTGHSLGGAAAVLLPLLMDGICPSLVCTFGQPRVLTAATAGRYPHPLRRFVGASDIVPLLPLPWRFAHVGDVRYVTTKTNGDLLAERRFGSLGKYLALLRTYVAGALWRLPRGESPVWNAVRDQHSMVRYRAALEKAAFGTDAAE